jgi:hypothetical protein
MLESSGYPLFMNSSFFVGARHLHLRKGMSILFSKIFPLKRLLMNTTKMLISGIAGGVVAFFAGWLIYGMLLMDFMAENSGTATGVMRPDAEMVWWALILGNICTGILYSYIFNRWANISTLSAGLSAGAVIGLIMGASFDLTMYGTSNILAMKAIWVDIAASAVLGAIVGGVVGWVNGMGKKA